MFRKRSSSIDVVVAGGEAVRRRPIMFTWLRHAARSIFGRQKRTLTLGSSGKGAESVATDFGDRVPRYPSVSSAPGLLRAADLFCTAIFAASGAITAAGCGMDVLGATIVGSITALGGGTVREAIYHPQPATGVGGRARVPASCHHDCVHRILRVAAPA